VAAIKHSEQEVVDWIPPGPVRIGVTAGASTPNNKIGDVVTRIFATRGLAAQI
jgi:4-hydroxy-3-methylbut-2-enyl diphosphate reductase